MTYLQTLQQEVEARYPKAYSEYLDISGNKRALNVSDEELSIMQKMIRAYKEGKLSFEP